MEENRSNDQDSETSKALSSYSQAGVYIGSGFQFAATIAACLFAGWWADGKLGTSPLLVILSSLAGAGTGFYYLVRALVRQQATDKRDNHGAE